ncbi:MAG TPA: DUF3592 domain-containing protein [Terriglobales bacterium]|jgi:hypothetical protein
MNHWPVFLLSILLLMLLCIVLIMRSKKQTVSGSSKWQTAIGTVETGVYELGSSSEDSIHHLCVLTYSYRASSAYFGGQVKVTVAEPEVAEWLIKRMQGRELEIQYDPKCPERSMFAGDSIEGQVVHTNSFL